MKPFLQQVMREKTLSVVEAEAAMELIFSEEVEIAQVAAFVAALHLRGETQEELLGFVRYFQKQTPHTVKLQDQIVLDNCGTGGDYQNTFNISTTAALLLASEGVKVAKHGGRAVSGKCGSADVLQGLGIPLQENPQTVPAILEGIGFAFLAINPALGKVRSLRQLLGVRTCFNIMGPLLNPLRLKHQVLGVYSPRLLRPVAEILAQIGVEEAMVVHSQDGLDEFSVSAPTEVVRLSQGNMTQFTVDPKDLGVAYSGLEHIAGGDVSRNVSIIERVFSGEEGAPAAVVALNAAAGLVVAGVAETLREGVEFCRQNLKSGKALGYLQHIQQFHSGE